jgi:hypothetical protein
MEQRFLSENMYVRFVIRLTKIQFVGELLLAAPKHEASPISFQQFREPARDGWMKAISQLRVRFMQTYFLQGTHTNL